MNKIAEKALDNLKEQPAIYTVMIFTLSAITTLVLTQFSEPDKELFRLGGIIIIAFVFIACLYFLFKSDSTDTKVKKEVDSFVGNHFKSHLNKIQSACLRVSEKKESTHPLIIMIGDFMVQLSGEIERESVEIPSRYYVSCFSSLKAIESIEIYAIADLCTGDENWSTGHETMWKNVKERVFHIHWEDMFSPALGELLIGLKKDEEQILQSGCKLKLITTLESSEINEKHPLDEKAPVGKHLLIISDSLVGGYISKNDGEKLYLQASRPNTLESSKEYYKRFQDLSIEIDINMAIKDIRNHWINKADIGKWNNAWNGKQERDRDYVEYYDQHILCWIADYPYLLNQSRVVVRNEISMFCKQKSESLNILELGCGTGKLTKMLFEDIKKLNNVVPNSVESFFVIDQSEQMLLKTESSIDDLSNSLFELKFEWLKFDKKSENILDKKFNVIVGTLIFHFLIGKDWDKKQIIDIFINLRDNWLSDSGCIIFGDIFFTKDIKSAQITYWKEFMKEQGMSLELVEMFFENNHDMVSSPDIGIIREVVQECDMKIEIFEKPNANPFNVIKVFK
jgi:SAM-dependent methyltransferase